jgi:tetraacyldisaccharide 4'-kinase
VLDYLPKKFIVLERLALKVIDKLWFGKSRWACLLLPLSALYALVVTLRWYTYRIALLPRWQAALPVIVVGNLTVGGNGKTPLVIWLVQQLQARGVRVGVVSRGYGGDIGQRALEVNKACSATIVGDEPLLIAQRTGAPVAVAAKRARAVALLCQRYPLDAIIADDGLQHYGLRRDLEFVVIDGQRRFGNGYWLPAGPLREGIGRLQSVDAMVVHGGTPQPGELPMQLRLLNAVNLLSGEQCPVAQLPPSVAMAGIGHPERFFTLLTQQGLSLQGTTVFRDHQPYRLAMLQSLTLEHQPLLMTEKDAVKCRLFAQPNWWFLPVEAVLPAWAEARLIHCMMEKISRGSKTA